MNAIAEFFSHPLPGPTWREILRTFLLGFWERECRHAERPERFVPYC